MEKTYDFIDSEYIYKMWQSDDIDATSFGFQVLNVFGQGQHHSISFIYINKCKYWFHIMQSSGKVSKIRNWVERVASQLTEYEKRIKEVKKHKLVEDWFMDWIRFWQQ